MISCRFSVLRSAADKMNDLQKVAFRQAGFRPLIAGNDASVQLDGNTIGFHPQLVDQACQRERRVEIPSLAVDL